MKLLVLYIETIRYLKPKQIYYQIIFRIKQFFQREIFFQDFSNSRNTPLRLLPSIPFTVTYKGQNEFMFLNRSHCFVNKIDWNDERYGKLWCYNLNYFDFLHQPQLSKREACALMEAFCEDKYLCKVGIEPYPISLRGINWIKYFVTQNLQNHKFDSVLYSHYSCLAHNLEYHLLGNHLLENGFSLLFAAFYFNTRSFYRKAKQIIKEELKEQLLEDGAHFELSPMYHQIVLFRLLDCINLVQNNDHQFEEDLLPFLRTHAEKMMGWLAAITFASGEFPMVNDSAHDIGPTSSELMEYADRLGIKPAKVVLHDSGYRMIRQPRFELFLDVGNIGPDYIPGHAHSDTFNFILYVDQTPVIVDTGISTYENNSQRLLERSTQSHNTVRVLGYDQSRVWSSFRVGRRAKVTSVEETDFMIAATHNGYKFIHAAHQREWTWSNQKIVIRDSIEGIKREGNCEAFLHFHPTMNVEIVNGEVKVEYIDIAFSHELRIELGTYDYALGFNKVAKAQFVKVQFNNFLETIININN